MAATIGLGAPVAAVLEKLVLTTAWAQTQNDYKALVCVFLNGGNDGNQTLVPLSGATGFPAADVTGGYPAYFNERNGQGLAIPAPPATGVEPAGTLLRISPGAANPNLGTFGLNPRLGTSFVTGGITVPSLKALYDAGKLAFVCNVGTLIQPLTKAQFQAGNPRPNQLFSHADQISENQTCIFTGSAATGWGGRVADKTLVLNGTSTFPMETSISGAPQFMAGNPSFPIVINPAPTALNAVLVLSGFGTASDEAARKNAFNQLRTINQGANSLIDKVSGITDEALAVSASLSVDPQLLVPDPAIPGTNVALAFPNTAIGNQLKQVAKVIKANLQQPALGLKRQIFFCALGSYDTHQNENTTQPTLLQQTNEALSTFYYWLQNNVPGTGEPTLGDLTPKVTSFALSDFNRTFNPAGQGTIVGTDHAWGNHWFVLGGAVNGGQLYGLPLPGGNGTVFPTLGKGTNNAYDVDNSNGRGRWIPSVSTSQYANTLAAWYGLPQDAATLDYVFPTLRTNFAVTNLGFV
jgi:uncharacterized protein (DUF1501 family)